jgi:hypothetical protein
LPSERGNAENKFVEAEANYRISIQNFQATAPFNLGNTIYKQKQSSEGNLLTLNLLKIQNTTAKTQSIS